jgi:predicted ATPase/DNA-binding winged helix-turn-helix (wHTH) protein
MRRLGLEGGDEPQADPGRREAPILFGRCRVLPHTRQLVADGRPCDIGSRAFDLLMVLIEARGLLVSKEELIKRAWPTTFVDEGNLRVQMVAIRKALGEDRDLIKTIPGRGYLFSAETTVAGANEAPEHPSVAHVAARSLTNLPRDVGSVIGREIELAELRESIGRNRLVTVVGAGGIGKTRLAIELGWQVLELFPDGVWLIDLAPITDQAALMSATAAVLGMALQNAQRAVETIAAAVGKRRRLLIFDNCEHLVGAAAAFIERLLKRASRLTALATSQERLRLADERIYRLNPLSVPPAGATEIAGFGAVALFVERAHASDRRFVLNAANAQSVAEICRRLDGIPLALQMAAARLPVLGIERLRAGLGERLKILKTDLPGADTRQQTLLATVQWSHGLLDGNDTELFRRLAVFAGSFSLDAVVAVAGEAGVDHWEVIDGLGRLIDKSLVIIEGSERPRYRLLETLRLYAAEQLAVSGESDRVTVLHARYLTDLLERACGTEWETMLETEWLETYLPELDNVGAALDWLHGKAEHAPVVLALTAAAALLWFKSGTMLRGSSYVERASSLLSEDTPPAVAAGLLRFSGIYQRSSDGLQALRSLERSATLYRQLGERLDLARVLNLIGYLRIFFGQRADGKAALDEAWNVLSAGNYPKSLGNLMIQLGIYHVFGSHMTEARACFSQALDIGRALKDVNRESEALLNLAEVEYQEGNVDRAVELGRDLVRRWRLARWQERLARSLTNLASYLIGQGNLSEARSAAAEALPMHSETGGRHLRYCLLQWSLLGALDGQYAASARLIGFVSAGKTSSGEEMPPIERQIIKRLEKLFEPSLSAADIEAYAAEGARWRAQEAVRFVQAQLIAPGSSIT